MVRRWMNFLLPCPGKRRSMMRCVLLLLISSGENSASIIASQIDKVGCFCRALTALSTSVGSAALVRGMFRAVTCKKKQLRVVSRRDIIDDGGVT